MAPYWRRDLCRGVALLRTATTASAMGADPLDSAFLDRRFHGVGDFHQLVCIFDKAFAAAIVAVARVTATVLGECRTGMATFWNANRFAFAVVAILRFFLRRAIGVADGNEPFVTAAFSSRLWCKSVRRRFALPPRSASLWPSVHMLRREI